MAAPLPSSSSTTSISLRELASRIMRLTYSDMMELTETFAELTTSTPTAEVLLKVARRLSGPEQTETLHSREENRR